MADLTNSRSLTEFQRNAKSFIDGMNESREPLLITVNGKVQAVLVDPVSFQQMEELAAQERIVSALKEGLKDIDNERTRPIDVARAEMKAKYGL